MFFESYNGCYNQGGDKKPILIASFTKAVGGKCKYGENALKNLMQNPPNGFSEDDYVLANCAIKDIEHRHLWRR